MAVCGSGVIQIIILPITTRSPYSLPEPVYLFQPQFYHLSIPHTHVSLLYLFIGFTDFTPSMPLAPFAPPTPSTRPSSGSLKLILGPMFSGKSTRLLHEANTHRAIGKRVLCINHTWNNRYSGRGITTHNDGEVQPSSSSPTLSTSPYPTIVLNDLRDLCNRHQHIKTIDTADVICIEEIQFFRHTIDTIRYLVDTLQKQVCCAGLIADYQRKPFGDVFQLIPLADEVIHLKALCTVCNDGTPGIFTQRLASVEDDSQVLVGEREAYRSVCRCHYLMLERVALEQECDVCEDVNMQRAESVSCLREAYQRARRMSGDDAGTGEVVPWYVDDGEIED